jgi:hypothetical protein
VSMAQDEGGCGRSIHSEVDCLAGEGRDGKRGCGAHASFPVVFHCRFRAI